MTTGTFKNMPGSSLFAGAYCEYFPESGCIAIFDQQEHLCGYARSSAELWTTLVGIAKGEGIKHRVEATQNGSLSRQEVELKIQEWLNKGNEIKKAKPHRFEPLSQEEQVKRAIKSLSAKERQELINELSKGE